jgi:hypothetical protein
MTIKQALHKRKRIRSRRRRRRADGGNIYRKEHRELKME